MTQASEYTAAAIIQLIRDVAKELNIPSQRLRQLNLDTSFERDLGLDSLSRLEILARIEKQLDVTLPEHLLAEVETPRDLLRAVLTSTPGGIQRQVVQAPPTTVVESVEPIPLHATTLQEVLDWHCQHHPERRHITLYHDEGPGENLTYADLAGHAKAFACGLQAQDIQPGDTVALMLPTGKDYFFTFFGILLAGAIPVPIYPPARLSQLEDHLLRHSRILDNCQARLLVTVAEAKGVARLLRANIPTLTRVITPQGLAESRGALLPAPRGSHDIAFLQYTSGSTGAPKGVILTHFNLLSNIRAMGETIQADSKDTFVSWLPLYHDMGLIGAWLGSLYYGAHLVVMSPLVFLARPDRWLWAIHRYRATLTAAPNFAYGLCLKRLAGETLEGLTLDSLRAMFNGAEPVSPETLEHFVQRFQPHGLNSKVLMPVYGLAENAVGLTFPPLGRGPLIDAIERDTLCHHGKAVPTRDMQNCLRFVSCGLPLPGHEVRIVDFQGRELPEREEGKLEFRGPSSTSGYYRNPHGTAQLFDAEWLISGDRAYMAAGEVYLTGREKDIIIHAGRNLYPQEIEDAVGRIAGIRTGCIVAFGIRESGTGTEHLIVVAETRETDSSRREALIQAVNQRVIALAGSPPDQVILAPPGTVLKTSSGKVRRSACRELYEHRLLGRPLPLWRQVLHLMVTAVHPLAYRWRRQVVALFFAGWAWGATLFVGTLAWLGVLLLPRLEWRWQLAANSVRLLSRLTGIEVRAEGLEHLPPPGESCVFVSNHASYLDGAAILASLLRPVAFVAKREFSRQFIAGTFLRRLGCEFVERFAEQRIILDAQRLAEAVRSRHSLWFFPEGTFTRQPGLLPFRLGAFLTAAESGAAVVPVTIRGTRSILRAGSWFPRHGRIRVIVSPPLSPQETAKELASPSPWKIALSLRDLSRQAILTQLGEPDLGTEQSPLLRR